MENLPIDHFLKPINRFIRQENTAGIFLFISVVIALVWANSPFADTYHHLWENRISIKFSGYQLDQPLHTWINDGLMTLFFFVIGLELKREFRAGELSTIGKASLPMMAALGGMLVPAAIYLMFNANLASSHGWGIPMATDIAFALGLLSVAGKNIPPGIKVFLSALAVADDLGAVLVIAFFYTANIAFVPLVAGFAFLLLLWIGNIVGIRSTMYYLLFGAFVWLCFLFSGVHATIAGVLVAFMIPGRTKIDEKEFVHKMQDRLQRFDAAIPQDGSLTTAEQHHIIEQMKQLCLDAETPLQKIEHGLHPWVTFLIMPLFALSNAGIAISSDFFTALANPVSLGVGLGLIAGKFAGVLSFTWLMVKFRVATLPGTAGWKHMSGVALLAGVGFTMSLFVTELAFDNSTMIDQAKSSILLASLIAGGAGVYWLRRMTNA